MAVSWTSNSGTLLFRAHSQHWGTPTKKSTYTALQLYKKSHAMYLKINHRLTPAAQHQSTAGKDLSLSCLKESSSHLPYPFIFFLSSVVNASFQSFPSPLHFSLPASCVTAQAHRLSLLTVCGARCTRNAVRGWGVQSQSPSRSVPAARWTDCCPSSGNSLIHEAFCSLRGLQKS